MEPLTLRYNNPGAVEYKPWMSGYGARLGPNGRYAAFDSPDQGYSVMGKILDTYQGKHGLNTVAGIVNRWAPSNVDNNSTGSYVDSVARRLGVDPNAPLTPQHRTPLMQAMAAYEAGRAPAPIGGAAPAATQPQPTGAASMSQPQGQFGGWTPESVSYGRTLGKQLIGQGLDSSPVGHWTQALGRVLQAGSGAAWNQQANEGERAGNQAVAQIYKQGLERGLPINQIAADLMGNPFGQQQGQQLAQQHMTTQASQGFARDQQNRQHELQIKLMQAKSQMERDQLLNQARTLGLIPAEPPSTAAAPVNGYYNNDPAYERGVVSTAPAPVTPAAEPRPPAQLIADPYARMLTPAQSPQQVEEDRRKRASQAVMVGDPKGAMKILNKDEDLKEHQTKDALWAERMMRSEVALRGIERQYAGTVGQSSPAAKINNFWPDSGIVANMTNSQSWREYQQASREWIAAMLRKDTGAAVTESEWKLYFPTYFPQPGDSAQVLDQKRAARMAASGALREASGPAFERMFPSSRKELFGQIETQNRVPPRAGAKQPAAPAATAPADVLGQARDAITRGANRDAVIKRLRENGIDPAGL
jgi:hypothetical protein